MIRPVTEICWKKTYLMPSDSIRCVSASMRSRRPGWLRASSSVAGAGAIRGLAVTVATVPPNEGVASKAMLPLPSPSIIWLPSVAPGLPKWGRLYRRFERICT